MKKFLMFITVTLVFCAAIFGIYWKYVRVSKYPVFIESFDNGVLTVESSETEGTDNKYKVMWEKGETITINIRPERTDKKYCNLARLLVNGVDVTKQVSMLQYKTPVESKLTVLAYFKEGVAPEGNEQSVSDVNISAPVIEKYYDNDYVGSYAAYDVEDPALFYDSATGYYYCFGSDNVVIKSKDMVNWTGRTTYFATPENASTNAIMDFSAFPSVEAWAKTHGYDEYLTHSDSNNDRTPLAPEIVKVGSVYYLYFSLSKQSGANESAIFVAKTKNLEYSIKNKVWYDGGLVISSCGRHSGQVTSADENGNQVQNSVEAKYDAANAVHPAVTFNGSNMYMVYGGYQGSGDINGGIYLVELDIKTGLLKADSSVNSEGSTISSMHGSTTYNTGILLANPGKATALSKNSSSLISAADIVLNKDEGYYYLFMTYGVDDTNYNVRVARSTNVAGPYTDFDGNNVSENTGDQYTKGLMVLGGYNFTGSSTGLVSYTDTGRASMGSPKLIKTADGKWFIACQSQLYYKVGSTIATGGVIAEKEGISVKTEPCLDIREVIWDGSGWPVVMPEIYAGDSDSADITEKDMLGNWDMLVFDKTADKNDYRAVSRTRSKTVTVFENAVISNTAIKNGTPFAAASPFKKDGDSYKIIIDGVEYKVHPSYVWDWELKTGSLVFTGLGADGSTIWGKKNFSGTGGVYTDAFYYLYNQCDDALKLKVDAKVSKFSSNPTQAHVDALSKAIIKQLIATKAAQ